MNDHPKQTFTVPLSFLKKYVMSRSNEIVNGWIIFLLHAQYPKGSLLWGAVEAYPELRRRSCLISTLVTWLFTYLISLLTMMASFPEDVRTHQSDTPVPYNPESEQINPTHQRPPIGILS